MNRNVLGLRDQARVAVEERARMVETFFDIGRVRAVANGNAHLFARIDQRIFDHFDGDRIEVRGHARSKTSAASSTRAFQPSATYVQLSASSISAGPGRSVSASNPVRS